MKYIKLSVFGLSVFVVGLCVGAYLFFNVMWLPLYSAHVHSSSLSYVSALNADINEIKRREGQALIIDLCNLVESKDYSLLTGVNNITMDTIDFSFESLGVRKEERHSFCNMPNERYNYLVLDQKS
ncbi:hypothetical protein GCM10011369_26520 [Neiella marina]|uniref:Uncharacterized protein n=1 Tax=Neiella marina TaxID=508461 RepID=A0A8J2U760_9GAMM|nr:hypothetical protein GCM10011369_26520 [Neiella marina]